MKVTHWNIEMFSQALNSYFTDSNLLVNLATNKPANTMSESPHQLAAIMFTDIVGYSALMGEDEDGAFDLLELNRTLQKPIIEAFGGTFLKEIGDGILISFASASDAVYCAGAIHEATQSVSNLSLRIGIHIGDVVFKESDVFGDGVNIASRIQELANPGQTLITESVHRNIGNKKGIYDQFISEERLKNISDPIRIYETRVDSATLLKNRAPIENSPPSSGKTKRKGWVTILVAGCIAIMSIGYLLLRQSSETQNSTIPVVTIAKSLVVLPFVNLSNDPDQEYFSDGITEEIINAVVQYQDLKVIGRTSAFAYKDQNIDLKLIGQQLNVQNILEGSIRKDGNRIRVTAQLINANDGYHIWSEQYDRELIDIFEIQREISAKIADKLHTTLLRGSVPSLQVTNLSAYDAVLQGNFQMAKPVPELGEAIEFYNQALELDPNYSLAYTQLGWAYIHRARQNPNAAGADLRKAGQAFRSALHLDQGQPRAHLGLAWIDLDQWQWTSAAQSFEAARALNASDAGIFDAWYQTVVEADFDAATRIIDEMIENDPLAVDYLEHLGQINLIAGRYAEALSAFSRALEIDPKSADAYRGLGWSHLHAGNISESIVNFSQSKELSEHELQLELELVLALISSDGDLTAILEKTQSQQNASPMILAKLFVLKNEPEMALSWLDQAFEQKSPGLASLKVAKIWDPLRTDRRFQALLTQLNFPDKSSIQAN